MEAVTPSTVTLSSRSRLRTCRCNTQQHRSAGSATETSSYFENPCISTELKHTEVRAALTRRAPERSALTRRAPEPLLYSHFWALGLDWTSSTTVVTASAYMSLSGLAIH
ncbi:hypothetical protein EYF80_053375 [Liparis tanakae]|uniref:Uncharacterized protein n=1 Tax=Liparis tanakae TaxID=230148 RepID=A0A4Z2F5Q9_9TELE|nr:hypothetical protein EYF80_053375 [Liparis tanakae]